MNIQPLNNSSLPSYSKDPKARARLAAALGLAASLGLAACQDDPLSSDPQSGTQAVTDSLGTSSSSTTAGMPEYSSSSANSSSSQDTLGSYDIPESGMIVVPVEPDTLTVIDTLPTPIGGDIVMPPEPDTVETDTVEIDTLIAGPTAGVIMLPMSSALPASSSSSALKE